ncbi:MAG: shikimate dehydrogenase [Sedimentisphaerales bacterium]|nr:shikimate dehydrogenase [Sedimentisphaerales bacterium]
MTRLTVPIAADNFESATAQIKSAYEAEAEVLELRTDYLKDLSVELVIKLINEARNICKKKLPIIVTCRSRQQGGSNAWPDKLRIEVLVAAIKAGAEYIDFEYDSFTNLDNQEKLRVALSSTAKTRLILSAHDFDGPFDDIAKLYRHIVNTYSAAIPKLVYKADHINDCFYALDLLSRTSDDRIIFCMGEAGIITRIIAKKLGSYVTFASLADDTATAPGQLTIDVLKNVYRYDDIDKDTELYGVIGSPITHSLGPAVHNACFAKIKANKLYLPILLEGGKKEFDDFINNLMCRKALGFKAFSVTIPHKQNVLNYVRMRDGKIDPVADIIGAANTFIFGPDDRVSAYNTDCGGALEAIESAGTKNLNNVTAAVIGAGGVARALVAGLTAAGANVTIYNRTVKKAHRLADEFNCQYAGLDQLQNCDVKLLVNCTSVGMYPDIDATAVPLTCLKSGMLVFDTVYNPAETLLLKNAKAAGCKIISGLEMFINQAAEQFNLFTKQDPDTKLMRRILTETLQIL